MTVRIPDASNWPAKYVNRVHQGDALARLRELPDACVALAVTSPPYWNIIDYDVAGQLGQTGYEQYLEDMLTVWRETERVLIPNGKLAIVTPIMPIAKAVMGDQTTRHLKNISSDIEHTILGPDGVPGLHRYSLFVWQKQTSTKMFGSYPYPPNLYEDNTIEFINVYVKQGSPPSLPNKQAKEASRITQEEWRNLTMQVWPIYPEDVKRAHHPAPFPVSLPLRLIRMYTFRRDAATEFEGDIVLDMFAGTGSTCVAARASGRNYIGIELHPDFVEFARQRAAHEDVDPQAILLEPVRVKGARSTSQSDLFAGK